VIGLSGRHKEAAIELRRVLGATSDPLIIYAANLFPRQRGAGTQSPRRGARVLRSGLEVQAACAGTAPRAQPARTTRRRSRTRACRDARALCAAPGPFVSLRSVVGLLLAAVDQDRRKIRRVVAATACPTEAGRGAMIAKQLRSGLARARRLVAWCRGARSSGARAGRGESDGMRLLRAGRTTDALHEQSRGRAR